jgi:hypothetical protein
MNWIIGNLNNKDAPTPNPFGDYTLVLGDKYLVTACADFTRAELEDLRNAIQDVLAGEDMREGVYGAS